MDKYLLALAACAVSFLLGITITWSIIHPKYEDALDGHRKALVLALEWREATYNYKQLVDEMLAEMKKKEDK